MTRSYSDNRGELELASCYGLPLNLKKRQLCKNKKTYIVQLVTDELGVTCVVVSAWYSELQRPEQTVVHLEHRGHLDYRVEKGTNSIK